MKISDLERGDVLYYARALCNTDIYEVVELKLRTVRDTWFVGFEKATNHAYTFGENDLGRSVFTVRKDALAVVKEKEKNRKVVSKERIKED